MLGPIGPRCASLERFARGDDEKRACGLVGLGSCRVISVGSANNWGFERAIVQRTCCRVDTFDCTLPSGLAPPVDLRGRVELHERCLGARNESRGRSTTKWSGAAKERVFLDWPSMLRSIGLGHAPDFLKVDIEGFEYDVLRNMLRSSPPELLPRQIGVELHYKTQFRDLSWFGRYISAGEIALFMDFLWRAGGYLLVDRNDNPFCKHCTELLLARMDSQQGARRRPRKPELPPLPMVSSVYRARSH